MKRRSFLTATGTVGLMGAVSGASVLYSGVSSNNILLSELNSTNRDMLDNFRSNVTNNLQAMELDNNLVNSIVSPVRIISEKSNKITYKNKSGNYVSLSRIKGIDRISIKNS